MQPLILGALMPFVLAIPAPTAAPEPAHDRYVVRAEPTAAPEINERDLGDKINSYVDGIISDVASDISGFVDSGILDFGKGFPTGSAVEKSLGISSSDVDAEPTQVLNLPSYGNWTERGWSVRVHGNVYKIPNVSQSKIDDLANVFLIDTSVDELDAVGKAQARNVTKSIFVLQQGDESVTINFVDDTTVEPDADGSTVPAQGGAQSIDLPYNTTVEGDFDTFVTLRNTTGSGGGFLVPGNQTTSAQAINMYAQGTDTGNATAYLVPPDGLTIISDIDDILRITKIYEPKEGLLNTFARPFTPWMNMPDIYANWSSSVEDLHFHYLTTTPEQATRNYMDFVYKTYPLGSFDTRPLNFSDGSATLAIRRFLLDKVFETFPQRKFILVADTSNSDVMKAYPALYHDHPEQVTCILLRNTSSTDDGDKFPYDTSGFKDIPQERFMFFHVPDDLTGLDIANGGCYNRTIQQNVTFDTQGLPFGLGDDDDNLGGKYSPNSMMAAFIALLATMMVFV